MKKDGALLKFPLKGKYVIMVAPSFIVDFSYPEIIHALKELGFDKVVELTFGAKLVNHEYHKILKDSKGLKISTVCPGVVDVINKKYSQYKKNLIKVDSPMIAMGKVVRRTYPKHKIVFLSPCNYKKIEAEKSSYVDYVIDYFQLKKLFSENKIKLDKKSEIHFDKFYNDYTKIYPLGGGLSQTAHLKRIISKKDIKVIDGISKVMKFLDKSSKSVKFFDCNFCTGGCIGGPFVNSRLSVSKKRKKVLSYLKESKRENIPEMKKGLILKAEGLDFLNHNL
ncbi:hypothetical protein HOD29_00950 [archaeon]|jgi:iron only hydrogenase large subunit-like protein|nr:hypothetical protein [archaeon]